MTDLVACQHAFEAQGMALYAAATRRRIAERTGDATALSSAFEGLKVLNPERMTAMLAPGLAG